MRSERSVWNEAVAASSDESVLEDVLPVAIIGARLDVVARLREMAAACERSPPPVFHQAQLDCGSATRRAVASACAAELRIAADQLEREILAAGQDSAGVGR